MDEPNKIPTLTSKNVPQAPAPVSTAPTAGVNHEPGYDTIRAVPLGDPAFTNVKAKRPGLSFRWIECKASDGRRLGQAEAQGYVYATVNDCTVGGMKPTNGRFINGDVVLMMMDRIKYVGALKFKEETALLRVEKNSAVKKGVSEVPALANRNHPMGKKVSLFVPPTEVSDALVGADAPEI